MNIYLYRKTRLALISLSVLLIACLVFLGGCFANQPNQTMTAEARNTQIILLTQGAQLPTDALPAESTQLALLTQRAEITQRTDATQTNEAEILTREAEDINATQSTAGLHLTQTAAVEDLRSALFWRANFETGDISQVQTKGDFLSQASGTYNMITQGHTGNYAVALTIDTSQPSETGYHAAYLFYWGEFPEAGYYSVWYYIPSGVQVLDWWTIMQWKSTYDGNSSNSVRVFSVGVTREDTGLFLTINQRPTPEETGANSIMYRQDVAPLPLDRWFHLETFYKKANDGTGQVILWQDGVEIFNLEDVNTTFADNTLYWSVHNYAPALIPNPFSIFVDDMAISTMPIGNTPLP